jgi:hypothetical protein
MGMATRTIMITAIVTITVTAIRIRTIMITATIIRTDITIIMTIADTRTS